MLSSNWTAKLEYLYYDLGSANYATGGYAVDLSPTSFAGWGSHRLRRARLPASMATLPGLA